MGGQPNVCTLDDHDWRGGEVNLDWFAWAGETKPDEPQRHEVGPVKIPSEVAGRVVLVDEDGPAAHVCLFIDGNDSGKLKIELSRVRGRGGIGTQLTWTEEVHEFTW